MPRQPPRTLDLPMSTTETGPAVEQGGVRFRLPDPGGRLRAARLGQEVLGDQRLLDMTPCDDGFELWLDRPVVDRMEYLFELTHADGSTTRELDPGNQVWVDGAFGSKSVVEFPGYRAPRWLRGPTARADVVELPVSSEELAATVPVRLWHPADTTPEQPLPLLMVHDGFEYDGYSSITTWAAAAVGRGWVTPFRLALLHPTNRTEWYAANPAYADALVSEVWPAIVEAVGVAGRPVVMGASLGALAAFHAHLVHPGLWGGLFLQSGSFFSDLPQDTDECLRPIKRLVADVHAAEVLAEPVPTVMTVGLVEPNVANNRRMVATLAARGYDARLHEIPDGHNYTAWRDSLHPHLTGLLARLWGRGLELGVSSSVTGGDS
jgi:enterochelin esterase-like enzyme